jgi:hypothetical protein
LLAALAGQGQADQAAAVFGHEIDRVRRDLLGRHDQIAFVLAIFIIHDDDHAPLAQIFDNLFGAVQ